MKRMVWTAAVLSALIVAAPAFASGPTSVTTMNGTYVSGDAASLAATDGNTYDVEAELAGLKYVASFRFSFSEHPYPFDFSWSAWATRRVRCSVKAAVRKTLTTGLFTDASIGAGPFTYSVSCHSGMPFTLHWDRFSAEPR